MAHLLKGAGGHLIKTAAGHLANGCAGADCQFCADRTPKWYNVVIAGITACACEAESGADGTSASAVCTIDANFTLTQSAGDACLWENADVGTIQVTRYSTADDCTGASETDTHTAQAHLIRQAANTFNFMIWVTSGFDVFSDLGMGEFWPGALAFYGTKVVALCDSNFVVDHTEACTYIAAAGFAFRLCENGTASCTPV